MSHTRSISRLLIVGMIAAVAVAMISIAMTPPAELFS
jgi:hypothetical protein